MNVMVGTNKEVPDFTSSSEDDFILALLQASESNESQPSFTQ